MIPTINPIGPLTYRVAMSGEVHTVRLGAFSGNGSCDCSTFTGCCQFLLEHGSQRYTRCDHILAARQVFEANRTAEKIVLVPEFQSQKAV